jgi:Tfp pilus assembly protein PilZ
MVEGVVAHSARVAPALQKIRDSGMGVRFLSINELVGELVPSVLRTRPAEPAAAPPSARKAGPAAAGSAQKPATAPPRKPRKPPRPPVEKPPAPPPVPGFSMRFSSLPQFLSVFERDIQNGGLFVPTQEPAAQYEEIEVEIHIPPPVDRLVTARAVVVQVVESVGDDPNLLAGMGVAFDDRSNVLARINALIYAG